MPTFDPSCFGRVRAAVFDVDGVMTDGRVVAGADGTLQRSMSIRDGYALKRAVESGLRVGVITGGSSEGVRRRLAGLGVHDYYSGVAEKLEVFEAYLARHGVPVAESLYMGDDLPDVAPLRAAGLGCAPADATPEVLAVADYVSHLPGGGHCVREVLERVLRLRGSWTAA